MNNQRFRKLSVWHKSMDHIEDIYRLTNKFPVSETYGLKSQLDRAATSIALNIAEGSGADTEAEYRRFLTMAVRSSYEVICGLEIAKRLKYCSQNEYNSLLSRCDELSAMITGLKKCLKKS